MRTAKDTTMWTIFGIIMWAITGLIVVGLLIGGIDGVNPNR